MDKFQKSPIIIGVTGGSGSGKTTLCGKLIDESSQDIALICQDAYYKDLSHLPPAERNKQNFDHPDAFDYDLLCKHLSILKRGKQIDVPEYDYVTHTRTGKFQPLRPKQFVLFEGIMLLAYPRIRHLFDYKIFLDIESDIRFIRRLERDITERGRSTNSVIEQYVSTVRPMHLEFVEPSKVYADVIIDSNDSQFFIKAVIEYIDSVQFGQAN
jgi:uridine kinase